MTDQLLESVCQAASREARGHDPQPGDEELLTGDLDRWAAALRKLAESIEVQYQSRRRSVALARESGELEEAARQEEQLADWVRKAFKFKRGVLERALQIDVGRARAAHHQLRVEVAAIVAAGQLPEAETAVLADLLAAIDDLDPLDGLDRAVAREVA